MFKSVFKELLVCNNNFVGCLKLKYKMIEFWVVFKNFNLFLKGKVEKLFFSMNFLVGVIKCLGVLKSVL